MEARWEGAIFDGLHDESDQRDLQASGAEQGSTRREVLRVPETLEVPVWNAKRSQSDEQRGQAITRGVTVF